MAGIDTPQLLRRFVQVCAGAVVAGAVACGGDGNGPSPTSTSISAGAAFTPEASSPSTVGLIAIGHSGLTGYAADNQFQDRKQFSWATGTAPEVNSIYQRLVAVRPEFKDHVANFAEGGASSDTLAFQASGALDQVANPSLVIIETIDNDIQCDGTDEQHVSAFGKNLSDALAVITKKSPDTKILVVSQMGRPAGYAAAISASREAIAKNMGNDMCALFDANGKLSDEHIRTLTSIIESYEAEQARVCATVPRCSTDNGAFTHFPDSFDALSGDFNHLNVKGLARAAETMWPTVAAVLGVQ